MMNTDSRPPSEAFSGDRGLVVVAHPDDETLWAGGFLLAHPRVEWTVVSLCRGSDPDRRPRFFKAMEGYGARGRMADLDDGPDQTALGPDQVRRTVLELVAEETFDLILTHDPAGEYTRHRRHEETARAVVELFRERRLRAGCLWRFAYEDGGKQYLPRAIEQADVICPLSDELMERKYRIITEIYGFSQDSWEARTTPRTEAFWCGLPGSAAAFEEPSD